MTGVIGEESVSHLRGTMRLVHKFQQPLMEFGEAIFNGYWSACSVEEAVEGCAEADDLATACHLVGKACLELGEFGYGKLYLDNVWECCRALIVACHAHNR